MALHLRLHPFDTMHCHVVSLTAQAWFASRWFKSDNITFTVGTEYKRTKIPARTYASFSEASIEVSWSR